MNELILSKIESLKIKFLDLKSEIIREQSLKQDAISQCEVLKLRIANLEEDSAVLLQKLIKADDLVQELSKQSLTLKSEIQELNFNQTAVSLEKGILFKTDLEIDFVVKEIDECIGQLKSSL